MIEKYNKITPGFVIQTYQKQGNKFVCTKQSFTAGDPVDRENEQGEPVDVDVREEQYQPFDMVQPAKDYYFLYVFGGVEAENIGPYSTEQERDEAMENHRKNEGREEYDSYFSFDVTKGSTVEF
jgi:hypothetical protein